MGYGGGLAAGGGAFGGDGGGGGNSMDAVTAAVFNAFKSEGGEWPCVPDQVVVVVPRDLVLTCRALADSDDGASIEAVVERLRSVGITRHQVEQAIQTLTTDGFIYSTVDEQHYRATS
jgi:hypothetical protein